MRVHSICFFFRYLPKENPPALSFPVKGTMVNLDRLDRQGKARGNHKRYTVDKLG